MKRFENKKKETQQVYHRVPALRLVADNRMIHKEHLDLAKLSTKLTLTISSDGAELFDYSLPQPHNYHRTGSTYTIDYILTGVFWSKKSETFLNDVLLRFNLSMNIVNVQTKVIKKSDAELELKQFRGLKSLEKKKFNANTEKYDDSVFWGLKLFVEHYIKTSDFIAYSTLFNFAYTHYYDRVKGKSTLKAKCRSIWNYYNDRDFKSDRYERKLTDEELKVTRSENAKKVAEEKVAKNYKNIVNVITGDYADEFKKKSGAWHIGKISKVLKMTEKTVSKYIKQYEKSHQNDTTKKVK